MTHDNKRNSDSGRSKLSGDRKERKRSNSNKSSSSSKKKRGAGSSGSTRGSQQISSGSSGAAHESSGYASEDTEAGSYSLFIEDTREDRTTYRGERAVYARDHPGVQHPDRYPDHPSMAIKNVDRLGISGNNGNAPPQTSQYSKEIVLDRQDNTEVDEYQDTQMNSFAQENTDYNGDGYDNSYYTRPRP